MNQDPILKPEVILEHAARYCAEHGSKLTTKRRQVLASLITSKKALSAYDLAEASRHGAEATLLPMSVYRILRFLQSIGLEHRLATANTYVACAHIACDHAHTTPQFLICKICSDVKEVGVANSIIDSIASAAETTGFRLLNDQLELECLCSECAVPELGA